MTTERLGVDYTRVSDDAAILCKRRDLPRAVNVLQRRESDRQRWRLAFRYVTVTADRTLSGSRRTWVESALREVVTSVQDRLLRAELVVDAREADTSLDLGAVLPTFTVRSLWSAAESVDLPMEYITMVTELPRVISAPINTAQVIVDCRRTANAHREQANLLGRGVPPSAPMEERDGTLDATVASTLAEIRAQQDAAQRWRALAQRLFGIE